MKYWKMLLLVFLFSCSHQGDRSISSTDGEDMPEVPEDYRRECVAKGGELESGDCQCLNGGKFIDPYGADSCPSKTAK